MIRARSIVVCLFLLALPCFAQMDGYTRSSSFSTVSNFTSSGCTQTVNCWHTGNLSMVVGASGKIYAANGHVIAVTTAGCAYLYTDYPSNTFTRQTAWGCGLRDVYYDGSGNLWSLTANFGTCSVAGSYVLQEWVASASSWLQTSRCLQEFSVAADGSAFYAGIGPYQGLLYTTNASDTSWTQITPGATYLHVAAVSAVGPILVANQAAGDVGIWNDGTWTNQTPLSVNVEQLAVDWQADIYLLGSDATIYHMGFGNSAWDHLVGSSFTSIADMGPSNVWASGPLTGSGQDDVYRFSEWGIQHTRTVAGSAETCPTGCTGVTHTITVKAGWGSTYGSTNQQEFSPPTNQANVQAIGILPDPFDCLEDGIDCVPIADDNVFCSFEQADLFDDNPVTPQFVLEQAGTQFTAPSYTPYLSGNAIWLYNIDDDCENTTTPDFDASIMPSNPYYKGTGPYTFAYRSGFQGFYLAAWVFSNDAGLSWQTLSSIEPVQVVTTFTLNPLVPIPPNNCTSYITDEFPVWN